MRGKIRLFNIVLLATIMSQFFAVMPDSLPYAEASHGTKATTPETYNPIYKIVDDVTLLSREASKFTDCDTIKPGFKLNEVFTKSLLDEGYHAGPDYSIDLDVCLKGSTRLRLIKYSADLDSYVSRIIISKAFLETDKRGVTLDSELVKLIAEYLDFDLLQLSSDINLEISRIYKLLVITENHKGRINGGEDDWVVNLKLSFLVAEISNPKKLIDDMVKQLLDEPTSGSFMKILALYASASRENDEKLHKSVNYYGSLRNWMSEIETRSQSIKPCGTKGGWDDIPGKIYIAMCATAIMVHDWSIEFLNEAANLLSYTSDMINPPSPGEGGVVSGFIFSGDLSNIIKIPIESELVNQEPDSFGFLIRDAYSRVLKLLNIVLILALLLLGLTNILQIQINTYAIKKALPGLLMGFLIAQGSFFFVRITLEVTGQATRGLLSVGRPTSNFKDIVKAFSGFPSELKDIAGAGCDLTTSYMTIGDCRETNAVDMTKVFRLQLLNLFMIVASALLFILGFLLLLRRFIFYALVPLAPLALLGLLFGPLNFIWNRWWKLYSGWLFMPLAAGFWVWLAMVWFSATQKTSSDSFAAPMLGYVFGVIALYLAIKTPFSMAGEAKVVMDKWNKFGKSAIAPVARQAKNAALTYTPAGAVVRGYNKYGALQKAKEKDLMEGDIVKNKWARKMGGDTLNRGMARAELKQEKKEEDQKGKSAEIKAQAEYQLEHGVLKTFAEALALRKNVKIKGKTLINFEKAGKSLGGFVDTVDRVAQRLNKLGVLKSFSYAAKKEEIADRKLNTEHLTTKVTQTAHDRFIQGGAMDRDKIRYKELVDEFTAGPVAFIADDEKKRDLIALAQKTGVDTKHNPLIRKLLTSTPATVAAIRTRTAETDTATTAKAAVAENTKATEKLEATRAAAEEAVLEVEATEIRKVEATKKLEAARAAAATSSSPVAQAEMATADTTMKAAVAENTKATEKFDEALEAAAIAEEEAEDTARNEAAAITSATAAATAAATASSPVVAIAARIKNNKSYELYQSRHNAIDRVAKIRRGKSAEIKGMGKANELALEVSEDNYAAENTYNVRQDQLINKLVFDNNPTPDPVQQDELFKVLNLRRKTDLELDGIMKRENINNISDVAPGTSQNNALRNHLTQKKIETADTQTTKDAVNLELSKRISSSINKKQSEWKTGYAADDGLKPNLQEILEAVLSGRTASLKLDQNSVPDIVKVEKIIGALFLGLRDEETATKNLEALLDPNGNIEPVLKKMDGYMDGYTELVAYQNALSAKPALEPKEIRGAYLDFARSNIGKAIQKTISSPYIMLSNSPYA